MAKFRLKIYRERIENLSHFSRLFVCLFVWLDAEPVGWLAGYMVVQFDGGLVGWLAGWLYGWLVRW